MCLATWTRRKIHILHPMYLLYSISATKFCLIVVSYVNYSQSGKAFRSAPSEDLETPDPPHEIPFVNISLEGEKHDGYVKAYPNKTRTNKGGMCFSFDMIDMRNTITSWGAKLQTKTCKV